MFPTRALRAYHYQPMIKFLGQRSKIPHEPHPPAPHPAAPKEVVDNFQSFLAKLQSSSAGPGDPSSQPKGQSTAKGANGHTGGAEAALASASAGAGGGGGKSKPVDYENFWEAPEYLWKTKEVSEREMEAVMSGGATDIRSGP